MASTQTENHARQMRAVVHERYGPPEVLHVELVAQPSPGPNQLLVEVHACTVNRTDCGFRAAKPFIVRFFSGLVRPKKQILGTEFAGVVEAVGDAVTEFAISDRVFGVNADVFGTQAECVLVKQDAPVAMMPAGVSFADAAAMCDGAILGSRTCGKLQLVRERASSCTARRDPSAARRYSSRNTLERTSRPCAARRTSSSYALSAPTPFSTTGTKTMPKPAIPMTSCSTPSANCPSPDAERPSKVGVCTFPRNWGPGSRIRHWLYGPHASDASVSHSHFLATREPTSSSSNTS